MSALNIFLFTNHKNSEHLKIEQEQELDCNIKGAKGSNTGNQNNEEESKINTISNTTDTSEVLEIKTEDTSFDGKTLDAEEGEFSSLLKIAKEMEYEPKLDSLEEENRHRDFQETVAESEIAPKKKSW